MSSTELQLVLASDDEGNATVDAIQVGGSTGNRTLSATALGNYEICGYRGQCYHDPNIPRALPAINMLRGSAWHAGMEFFNTLRKTHGEGNWSIFMPDDMLRAEMFTVMVDTLLNKAEEQAVEEEGEKVYLNLTAQEVVDTADQLDVMLHTWGQAGDPDRWLEHTTELVAFEHMLHVPNLGDTGVDFIGYADAIYNVMGAHIGVDYKATSKLWGGAKAAGDPRKLIQAPLYAEAYFQTTGNDMEWFAYDVMTQAGKFQRVWVPTNQQIRQPFIDRWKQVADQIMLHQENQVDFPTNPSHFMCSRKWCPYWDLCPMGAPIDEQLGINTGATT